MIIHLLVNVNLFVDLLFLAYGLDKDECSTPLRCAHIPNTVCVNRIGSFRCACKDGFTRTATGCKSKCVIKFNIHTSRGGDKVFKVGGLKIKRAHGFLQKKGIF